MAFPLVSYYIRFLPFSDKIMDHIDRKKKKTYEEKCTLTSYSNNFRWSSQNWVVVSFIVRKHRFAYTGAYPLIISQFRQKICDRVGLIQIVLTISLENVTYKLNKNYIALCY